MKKEKIQKLAVLSQQLENDSYQRDLSPCFAKAVLGDSKPLLDAFKAMSFGQGANSRAEIRRVLSKLEGIPLKRIPFPLTEVQAQNQGVTIAPDTPRVSQEIGCDIVIPRLKPKEIKRIISNFG